MVIALRFFFWGGGAARPPSTGTYAGPRSLLAFWMGGANWHHVPRLPYDPIIGPDGPSFLKHHERGHPIWIDEELLEFLRMWTLSKSMNRMSLWIACCLPTNQTADGRRIAAHRAVWESKISPIPDGIEILRACGNARCVKLSHLVLWNLENRFWRR